MLRFLGIALLCLAALAPIRVEAEAPTVVVKRGDVLVTIARREGVSVAQLKRWNGLDSDFIRIGQELKVGPAKPTDRSSVPARTPNTRTATDDGIDWTPPFDHAPEPTAARARRPDAIAARDPSTAVATRGAAPRSSKKTRGRTYRVQKGDTLGNIALRHETTIEELLEINPGLDPNRPPKLR